jgi:hypothetical protein
VKYLLLSTLPKITITGDPTKRKRVKREKEGVKWKGEWETAIAKAALHGIHQKPHQFEAFFGLAGRTEPTSSLGQCLFPLVALLLD